MYAGSTFSTYSGSVLGAHQRIDRIARRQLNTLAPGCSFPTITEILRFEGNDGPDGVKRKSPAKDEPWHYLQPFDLEDTQLIDLLNDHYHRLIKALKAGDRVRASFEAAWLAHGMVDGLTPAHHYPFEERLVALSSGRPIEERTTIAKKILMHGDTRPEKIKNNWQMWGPKGLFMTHTAFEWGVAFVLAPMEKIGTVPNLEQIGQFNAQPFGAWYREQTQHIARMELYDDFYKTGWTIPLARRVRNQLIPVLFQSVSLAWYGALQEAKAK